MILSCWWDCFWTRSVCEYCFRTWNRILLVIDMISNLVGSWKRCLSFFWGLIFRCDCRLLFLVVVCFRISSACCFCGRRPWFLLDCRRFWLPFPVNPRDRVWLVVGVLSWFYFNQFWCFWDWFVVVHGRFLFDFWWRVGIVWNLWWQLLLWFFYTLVRWVSSWVDWFLLLRCGCSVVCFGILWGFCVYNFLRARGLEFYCFRGLFRRGCRAIFWVVGGGDRNLRLVWRWIGWFAVGRIAIRFSVRLWGPLVGFRIRTWTFGSVGCWGCVSEGCYFPCLCWRVHGYHSSCVEFVYGERFLFCSWAGCVWVLLWVLGCWVWVRSFVNIFWGDCRGWVFVSFKYCLWYRCSDVLMKLL